MMIGWICQSGPRHSGALIELALFPFISPEYLIKAVLLQTLVLLEVTTAALTEENK